MLEHAEATTGRLTLTPRESEVLGMIALGLTNSEVADRLEVTVHAVKFHLNHIYRKLGVSNRTEAAVAFQAGAATPEANGVDGDPERSKVLVEWNTTSAPYPDCRLHELIAARAQDCPDAVAVSDTSGTSYTYAELDRRAGMLARHLRAQGVERETLVGIAVKRSADMLVGLLGILKTGGAYVPIDPSYPRERVEYMLANAAAPVLLTEEALLGELPAGDMQVVCLDRDWPQIEQAHESALSEGTPEDLAYVIYTSGSTGEPKGVQIPHRALVNFLTTMAERPGLSADDVLLAVTTLSFDIAGLELYLPLATGAQVVVASHEAAADPRELARLLEARAVTVMQATPTTWRMLLDSGWPGRAGLKALCGGEALPLAVADALVERGVELWNMYGPTETTIWSTTTRVTTRGEPLTIGRPIANTTLYVLDEALAPVPTGEPGELHIGGAGLARGYRGRPDLTAERFIRHPFDPDPHARIYKTGDLVRYRSDGEVEFIGRIDDQVKVRGFRIELGEIESVLTRHDAVNAAVAAVREDVSGDPRVVAYVICTDGVPSSSELRGHAARSLPPYMVPSAIVAVDSFPLTPNGKVDRKALPAPSFERGEASYVEPRTPLEAELVRIWEDELDVRPIGVTDNFFDLGATSLVAARLFARIERDLGHALPLAPVFQAPTVAALAELIGSGGDERRWSSLVPIQPNGSKPPLFCVHGGAGTVLHLQPLARRLGDDQPFYGLQARGLYGGDPPLLYIEQMAAHYLSELRDIQPEGPYYLAGYCFGTIVAFEMAQTLLREGERVDLLVMFNGPSPLWTRMYRNLEEQPGRRARVAAKTGGGGNGQRSSAPASLPRKIVRVLRDPERLRRWIRWGRFRLRRTRERGLDYARAKTCMLLGRPIPEDLRGRYFLRIAAVAERAYEPSVYPGEILLFHGDGLYDDPALGWTGLAAGGVRSVAVPGADLNNRQLMDEPHIAPAAEQLRVELEHLFAHRNGSSEAIRHDEVGAVGARV